MQDLHITQTKELFLTFASLSSNFWLATLHLAMLFQIFNDAVSEAVANQHPDETATTQSGLQ
jgi:hypothetical protein